ncbi:hypothetical protein ACLOJK_015008, partial [Asimina triloba]
DLCLWVIRPVVGRVWPVPTARHLSSADRPGIQFWRRGVTISPYAPDCYKRGPTLIPIVMLRLSD